MLIKKFFATAAPVDTTTRAFAQVRVPDRSYMSAAKRSAKHASKKKSTPFTVVSSHQNKMGLMCIRPAVTEKPSHVAPVCSEAQSRKRMHTGDSDMRKKKKRKKKSPVKPSADVMAASAVAGPEIAAAIAAAAKAAAS